MTGQVQAAAPGDLPEICALTRGFDGTITYIAGGTDLIIALEHEPSPGLIVDISQIQDLSFVDVGETHIRIGAASTLTALAEHPLLSDKLAVISQAAAQVGSVQIRNRATIGGNIASAVPAGDLLPALKCLDAGIEVLDRAGSITTHGFEDIVIGPGETSLHNGDLITGFCIPHRFGQTPVSAFRKIGRRTTLTIARLNLAAIADYDRPQNCIKDIRLVAGAIGPLPVRLHRVERQLRGRTVDQSLANDFLQTLTAAVDETIPGRYSQAYKRRAIMGLGLELLDDLFGRKFEFAITLKALA